MRDGHGDLLCDDVFCLGDGPRLLDCLAFDDRLRHSDVLADAAFLAMDIEAHGAEGLGRRMLETWSRALGESHPPSLADHYVAYRAHVRAKVACLRRGRDRPAPRPGGCTRCACATWSAPASASCWWAERREPGTNAAAVSVSRRHRCARRDAPLAPRGPRSRGASAAYGEGRDSARATRRGVRGAARDAPAGLGARRRLDASWSAAAARAAGEEVAEATRSELVEIGAALPPRSGSGGSWIAPAEARTRPKRRRRSPAALRRDAAIPGRGRARSTRRRSPNPRRRAAPRRRGGARASAAGPGVREDPQRPAVPHAWRRRPAVDAWGAGGAVLAPRAQEVTDVRIREVMSSRPIMVSNHEPAADLTHLMKAATCTTSPWWRGSDLRVRRRRTAPWSCSGPSRCTRPAPTRTPRRRSRRCSDAEVVFVWDSGVPAGHPTRLDVLSMVRSALGRGIGRRHPRPVVVRLAGRRAPARPPCWCGRSHCWAGSTPSSSRPTPSPRARAAPWAARRWLTSHVTGAPASAGHRAPVRCAADPGRGPRRPG